MNIRPTRRRLHQWLGRQSVRHKLSIVTMLAVTCAALAASAALLVFRIFEQRADYEAETLALTQVVAENTTTSVSYQDPSSAESVLATLRAKPSLRGAVIDIPSRRNFTAYGTLRDSLTSNPRLKLLKQTADLMRTNQEDSAA